MRNDLAARNKSLLNLKNRKDVQYPKVNVPNSVKALSKSFSHDIPGGGKSDDQILKFLDTIETLDQTTSNFWNLKVKSYKELCERIEAFFKSEISTLESLSKQWHKNISEMKKKLVSEQSFFNKQFGDQSEEKSEYSFLINPIHRGDWERQQKNEQLENEISILSHNIQKMRNFENERERFIQDFCSKLSRNSILPDLQNTDSQPITIHQQPTQLKKMSVKFDLHRPYGIFLIDIPTLAGKKVRINNIKLPPDSASIYVNSRFFVCGGRSDSAKIQYCSTFELDMSLNRLNKAADMLTEKRNHSLASLENSSFYSICGYNEESGYLSNCEKYIIEEDKWITMPPTKEKRQDPTPCPVSNCKIYIIGGVITNEDEWTYLPGIEMLNTNELELGWKQIMLKDSKVWTARVYSGATQTSKNQILIFGGYNGTHLDQCFELDLENHTISLLKTKLVRPSCFISRNSLPISYNSRIYANSTNGLEMHELDLTQSMWTLVSKENVINNIK